MHTHNTPVHVRLWHKGFWALACSNLLLSMSMFMFLPVVPDWLAQRFGFDNLHIALLFAFHGIGIYLLGPFCSMLVEHYRRNKVCAFSIIISALASLSVFYFCKLHPEFLSLLDTSTIFIIASVIQIVGSALYGLSQMTLSGILIIDVCESFRRTEANHSAAWFGRLGLALGPVSGIAACRFWGDETVFLVSSVFSLAAMILVLLTDFPFRAPDESVHTFSTDRFFLSSGKWLFMNFLLITVTVGCVMVYNGNMAFYLLMLGGFLVALLSHKFVFADAELKSEILSALVLIIAALLVMIFRGMELASLSAAFLIGIGIGVSGARFLLFFIKLSRHCQRGTSQSSFFLTWQSGLAFGAALGIALGKGTIGYVVALCVAVAALVMYHVFTHTWYMKNKSR
ncbi:MAG: MFS transporter [Prevotella sp.]|uniref:MFS transporter n=1 Tax=Prevotella sp. TaxID=59823 RepID=UPI002A3120A5|nr:MFS transporter [Prevotella sp.]MDD7318219.1 MFS transporter [Prevotellaceae bacterium]MDY4020892.1 MFS transporter [Prevotella sp.]